MDNFFFFAASLPNLRGNTACLATFQASIGSHQHSTSEKHFYEICANKSADDWRLVFFGDQFQLITILKVALVRVWAPDLIALDQFLLLLLGEPSWLKRAWIIRDPDGSSRPSGPSRARSGLEQVGGWRSMRVIWLWECAKRVINELCQRVMACYDKLSY